MSSPLDAYGRHDELGQLWEEENSDHWNFDALNEGYDDWNIWDQPQEGEEQLWPDAEPTYFEPYASSSTLEEGSPPRASRDRSPRLGSRSEAPSYSSSNIHQPMGNTLSSAHNATSSHNLRASPVRTSTQTATSNESRQPAAYDPASSSHRHQSNPPDPFRYIPDTFNFDSFDGGNTPSDSFDGIDIDDLLNSDGNEEDEDMPGLTRHPQRSQGVVDLTTDSSPTRSYPRTLKRSAAAVAESASQPHPSKRSRRADTDSSAPTPKVEELDLTNEAPSAEEELRQAQQQAAIKAQQAAEQSNGPLKIGKRQCIICMEKYTDATITHCGHIYCHECLTQALQVGEKNSDKGIGNCPVCRKTVSRKKGNQMIVVNFMKKSAFIEKGRRQDVGSFG